MTAVRYDEITNWDHFATFVSDVFGPAPSRGRFLFRGQSSSDWRLESSFDRIFPNLLPADRMRSSQTLVRSFIEECKVGGYLPSELHQLETDEARFDINCTAFAQHHGLPTRLLDWSLSPWIAAFFAYSSGARTTPQNGTPALWVLDTHSDVWSDDSVAIVNSNLLRFPRIQAQSGCFTFNRSTAKTIDEYADELGAEPATLIQVELPSLDAQRALAHLEIMGLSPSSLFPDIEGACRAAMQSHALSNQKATSRS